MKKTVIAMLVTVAFAGTAFATDDVINLKKDVKFPHKEHVKELKDCTKCHTKAPGKIEEMGKEWAHKTCKGCHTEMKEGPTSCKGCHKS